MLPTIQYWGLVPYVAKNKTGTTCRDMNEQGLRDQILIKGFRNINAE
jgi:hypothetical protein